MKQRLHMLANVFVQSNDHLSPHHLANKWANVCLNRIDAIYTHKICWSLCALHLYLMSLLFLFANKLIEAKRNGELLVRLMMVEYQGSLKNKQPHFNSIQCDLYMVFPLLMVV